METSGFRTPASSSSLNFLRRSTTSCGDRYFKKLSPELEFMKRDVRRKRDDVFRPITHGDTKIHQTPFRFVAEYPLTAPNPLLQVIFTGSLGAVTEGAEYVSEVILRESIGVGVLKTHRRAVVTRVQRASASNWILRANITYGNL
jgi:hypothetical protein